MRATKLESHTRWTRDAKTTLEIVFYIGQPWFPLADFFAVWEKRLLSSEAQLWSVKFLDTPTGLHCFNKILIIVLFSNFGAAGFSQSQTRHAGFTNRGYLRATTGGEVGWGGVQVEVSDCHFISALFYHKTCDIFWSSVLISWSFDRSW